MREFSVVSVDMFGTLVDIDTIALPVWKQFLKDRYSPEYAKQCWERGTELVFRYYDEIIRNRQYVPPKLIYERVYSEIFPEFGIEFDPKEAAKVLALSHSDSEPFYEAQYFLEAVGKKYKICLSSDTDEDMLGQLRKIYPFDEIFTSEGLETYKTGSEGRFFSAVVEHYDIEPGRIIHIGDSLSDILGAGEAGIVTCWLNRKGEEWEHSTRPDYEVHSLIEAASILGVEISH